MTRYFLTFELCTVRISEGKVNAIHINDFYCITSQIYNFDISTLKTYMCVISLLEKIDIVYNIRH